MEYQEKREPKKEEAHAAGSPTAWAPITNK